MSNNMKWFLVGMGTTALVLIALGIWSDVGHAGLVTRVMQPVVNVLPAPDLRPKFRTPDMTQ